MKEAEVSFWDWFALTDRTVDTTVCLTQWEAQEDSYSMLYLACSFHVDFQSKHLDLFGHLKICFRCEFICKKKRRKKKTCNHKNDQLTWTIRNGPYKGGQHLDSSCRVGVSCQSVLHFPSEAGHDVAQSLVREPHGIQVFVNLNEWTHNKKTNW